MSAHLDWLLLGFRKLGWFKTLIASIRKLQFTLLPSRHTPSSCPVRSRHPLDRVHGASFSGYCRKYSVVAQRSGRVEPFIERLIGRMWIPDQVGIPERPHMPVRQRAGGIARS